MGDENKNTEIPFVPGDWLIDRNNPGQPGQYTGNWRKVGPHIMVHLSYPGGGGSYRPLSILEAMPLITTLAERLRTGHFGRVRDLQRLITFEKLKGSLHEIIYSMEAAQIEFYPYQFKPVLKFINSPTERLIIADEVGLGKTIESALIWLELQARQQARRLLVLCPKILAGKWRVELRSKFLFDAREVDFSELEHEIAELKQTGQNHSFVLISTYTGLRPPKAELKLLNSPPDEEEELSGSLKTKLLRELRHWPLDYSPFDMVIFDEAHYMRNPATTTFHLCEALATNAASVLSVSATPIHNSNVDLHSLLRLVDEEFFETQGQFEELLEANRPAVEAANALSRTPVDLSLLLKAFERMGTSHYIRESPRFKQLSEQMSMFDPDNKALVAKCQDLAEKLNILGNYVNRTRRVQVKENRPLRDPIVLQIEYSSEEMRLYKTILQIVRRKCLLDNRPFYVFQVLGLQLRAASCLPVIAQEIRNGRFGNHTNLLGEALGEEVYDGIIEDELNEGLDTSEIDSLLSYDFERNDTKYQKLRNMLLNNARNEKVIIFAFYRPTLEYLKRCLNADGVHSAMIHGGIPNERRYDELERFKDPCGPRVLLSSEVGSEGIDLQFCRMMVNYDMPWNPMRVEQRIGRIDRVGQQAKRLSIINFKILNTIEERLYDLLHSKLERFANSLGDLEDIIGKEVKRLTVELLSNELTPEEEKMLMEQSERVIEERLLQIQALEESGDALIALSDYVQRKIEEDREKGRYIQPEELEDYLTDFFEREFQGCEINHNTPADGCFRIKLSFDAHSSLNGFIRDDKSLIARPFRQKEFYFTFRREVHQRLPVNLQRSVHFINHLSPLIRWITKINLERSHGFFNVSAIKIFHSYLPQGIYCYRIERWKFKGLLDRERLAYGIYSLLDGTIFPADESEKIFQHVLRKGRDWDYVECNRDALGVAHEALEKELGGRFSLAVEDFEADNTTMLQIKIQRVKTHFDRRIAQDEQRLRTLREAGRSAGVIHATEGRLQKAMENRKQRLFELNKKAQIDMEQVPVAAGIFLVLDSEKGI